MLKLLRSGDEGALLQAYEEDQRYLQFQPCHGRLLLPGNESVDWCPALFSHDQEMLIYYSIFVQMNLKLLPNHKIRS